MAHLKKNDQKHIKNCYSTVAVCVVFKRYGPTSFCLISSFSQYNDQYVTIDYKKHRWYVCLLGIQTVDSKIEGTDESTEQWQPIVSFA